MSSSSDGRWPISLRCRSCGGDLTPAGDDAWACPDGHRVPVIAGIVDCRPPLAGFDTDLDRHLASELAALTAVSFEELLRHYWESRPDVRPELVERFVTGDLIAADRAAAVADQIEALLEGGLPSGAQALEIGGGTGALGVALADRCASVVITDISLAWLVLARRRVVDLGLDNVTIVAAPGDHLPIEPRTLDLIVAADVIEHVPSPGDVIKHCYTALRPRGALWVSTPNRFSLTPEPHVRLFGVGWLPRRWGRAYVRRFRGVRYDDIETLSLFGLRRLLSSTGGTWDVTAPEITSPVRATYGSVARRLIDLYHFLRRVPVVRRLVLVTTPLFHAVVVRPAYE